MCFSSSISDKECLVIEDQDGTAQIIETASPESEDVTDVGSRFRFLGLAYLAQGIVSVVLVMCHLIAIWGSDCMLRYRHWFSLLNRPVVGFAIYLLVMTHLWRLDPAGKLCSADTLTEVGTLLMTYLYVLWVCGGLMLIMGGVMGYGAYKMFT